MITLLGCVATQITATLAITALHCTQEPLISWGDVAIIEVDNRFTNKNVPIYNKLGTVNISCEPLRGQYTFNGEPINILQKVKFRAGNIRGKGYLVDKKFEYGQSGSPIFNKKGELVAIAHGYYKTNGVITSICR